VACGLYAFANYADQHPLSVLGYGARLATVAGMGHARVCTPRPDAPCPAPVAEIPVECPAQEVFEPIVVENVQPVPAENTLQPTTDVAALPPMPVYEEPPVLEMPPCPEDVAPIREEPNLSIFIGSGINAVEDLGGALTQASFQPAPAEQQTQPQAPIPTETITQTSNQGPISDCQIDPNYHHLYPGCPWMGGSRNVPAWVPAMPIEETRTRPAKVKWLTLRALLERLGLSGLEECEEPAPANNDTDPSNLTDIIF
jgi:hypothetical protein